MTDPLARVLKLVAEGRLTAEEAAPILDALDGRNQGDAWSGFAGAEPSGGKGKSTGTGAGTGTSASREGDRPRWARMYFILAHRTANPLSKGWPTARD